MLWGKIIASGRSLALHHANGGLLRSRTISVLPRLIETAHSRAVTTFAMAHVASFPVYQQFVHDSVMLFAPRRRRLRDALQGMLQESTKLADAQSLFITHARSLDFDVAGALADADRRTVRWARLAPLARLSLCLHLADQRTLMARRIGRLAEENGFAVVGHWVDWHAAQSRQQRAVLAAIWRAEAASLPPAATRKLWGQGVRAAAALAADRLWDGDRILARHGYQPLQRLRYLPMAAMTAALTVVRLARCARPPRVRG